MIDRTGPCWTVSVCEAGFRQGLAGRKRMARRGSGYAAKASRRILAQPFGAMLPAVYRKLPEMAVSSRIPPAPLCSAEAAGHLRMHPFLQGTACWLACSAAGGVPTGLTGRRDV